MVDHEAAIAIGARIRAARECLGRNRNQMARELGTSWQHVSRWEKGETMPGPGSLQKLASYLGVTVDHLMGREAESSEHAPEAYLEFLASYAPRDLSVEEREWLRAAPFADAPTPGDYVNLLHQVRQGLRPTEIPPAWPERVSGVQSRVDKDELLTRIREDGGDG